MPSNNGVAPATTVVMYYPCEHVASISTSQFDYRKVISRTRENVIKKVPAGIPIVTGYNCAACETEKIRKDPERARANGYLVTTY